MSKSKEWESLNRIWKVLSVEQRNHLYEDFKLVHSAIKKVELMENQTIPRVIEDDAEEVLEKFEEESHVIEDVLLIKNDVLKLKLEGSFFVGRNSSAFVLSNLFGFKLAKQWNNVYRTGFPSFKEDEYVKLIELNEINYILYGPGEEIYRCKEFNNNRFHEYAKKVMPPKEPVVRPSWINPGDYITILDLETQETLRYCVEESYVKYELSNNKDYFRNFKYKELWYSDAKIEEGSISIEAPIVKALKGIKEGNLFEVTVDKNKIKYKLISIERNNE